MVLQQSHPVSHGTQSSRLDPTRILGLSSTLALNVLALSFLLMPMTLPSPPPVQEAARGLEIIDIVPVRPVTPPPPEKVEVVRPRTPPPPQVAPRIEQPRPVQDVPVLVEQGSVVAEDVAAPAETAGAEPTLEASGPMTGMQLQYRTAPPPAYPRQALQRNYQGTVLLRVLVDTDGRPLEVTIERSSGHSLLDREAARHVQRSWRFLPATRDGQPVQAIGIVPIDFRLDRG